MTHEVRERLKFVLEVLTLLAVLIIAFYTIKFTSPEFFPGEIKVSTYISNGSWITRLYNTGTGFSVVSAIGYCQWNDHNKQCNDRCNNQDYDCYYSNVTGKFIFFNNFETLQPKESKEYFLYENYPLESILMQAIVICEFDTKEEENNCNAYPLYKSTSSFPLYSKSRGDIAGKYVDFPAFLTVKEKIEFEPFWHIEGIPTIANIREYESIK